MPFPESPRVVFQQNPIEQVVCQLRFPTILDIAATEPAVFQERIRNAYPLYERQEASALPREVAGLASSLSVSVPQDVTHNFATEDGQRTIALNRDFIAISERHYRQWEDFLTEFVRAQQAFEAIYR